MSENNSWSGLGEEIRGAVEDALQSGNFRDLGDLVVDRVTDTVRTVSSRVEQAVTGAVNGNYTEKYAKATRERRRERAAREAAFQEEMLALRPETVRPVERISGTLYRVFGGICTGITAILCAVFFGLSLGLGGGWWTVFFCVVLLLIGSLTMLKRGVTRKKDLRRALRYVDLAGHNQYINLADLALLTNKSDKFILKDVKKLLQIGYFPEGHLDKEETCLMLNDDIYREYLSLERQRVVLEREQRAREKAQGPKEPVAMEPEQAKRTESELEAMISQGQDCIRRLRDMNDNIPGEEISAKLFRLENLLKEIFEGLKEHPEQLPQMKKFMNYYLPTTLKLVEAYREFDGMSAQGEEVREAKTEIEKTLDTINHAFSELLNRMFRETAYDITTDAQVLQSMLAREGLASEKEFEKVPR
ncbi:MAG: 5-bromo-4-chloroindolyl phosphate hydrolysis family protein [Roseburia sp.]|nr:5-bromo-4-chloroindolyl phosphate hydrolysis family protein [Roseburia sp.]MCM1097268.1 5-bromo-4-chloroindolyl phosphate hydrolysis family protein [Ruminococcus flavefaciens]